MITVKMVGGPLYTVEFTEGLTAAQAVQTVKDENLLEFRGNYTFQDTITGRNVADSEILLDGRLYYLNVFVLHRSVV